MKVMNDWSNPVRDGSVSWIFAFEDPDNFGPARTQGRKFRHVIHQLKNPLESITSMCTEPVFTVELEFLRRHINMTSSTESPRYTSRAVLEFWVEWNSYLKEMKLPTYQIEQVEAKDIFSMAGLEKIYQNRTKDVSSFTNARDHRAKFTWQELYTIDPQNAAKAWKLARHYGYAYGDVDFANLTCLDHLPMCDSKNGQRSNITPPRCPPGTQPFLERAIIDVEAPSRMMFTNEMKGWVDDGCIEYKVKNGTFVGISGVIAKYDSNTTEQLVQQLLLQSSTKQYDVRRSP